MPELESSGVVTYYEQFGTGPDLLFLSGGDNTGAIWHRDQVPYFSERFRCTTYDARGVGRTRPLDSPPWPIELYGEDAAALIEAVCEPPVVLVGLSMGSLIAQELALTRPDLVRCAVLIGTAAGESAVMGDFGIEWMQAEVDFRRAGARTGWRTTTPSVTTTDSRSSGRRASTTSLCRACASARCRST